MGEAIPFIHISDDGTFEIDSRAMSLLQNHEEKKIACITIAGPYRTGKSFLANRFLGQMAGFDIGSTQKSWTRGIWMWNEPISINSEVDAFLIDTEGLHSVDRHTDLDSKIFTLSILLSSVFIFNTIGHITEGTIEELALVANLAKLIRLREPHEEEKENDVDEHENTETVMKDDDERDQYSEVLPILYWVLRDFSLDLGALTSTEYLDKCLKKIEGGPESLRKNEIRESIKSYFPRRECHPLVRPVFKEAECARIQNLDYSSLRPEFREGVESLISRILTRPKLKMIGGKHMTGSMLLGLAYEYVDAINNGEIPTVMDSFERVSHAEAQRFIDELIETNKTNLKYTINDAWMPMNEEELDEIFDEFIKKGIRNISLKLNQTSSVSAIIEVEKLFMKSMKEEFKELKKRNYNASMKNNYDLLVKLHKKWNIPKIQAVSDIQPSFIG